MKVQKVFFLFVLLYMPYTAGSDTAAPSQPVAGHRPSAPVYRIRDDQLEITGTVAYIWTCREGPAVEVKTAQGWRTVQNARLPIGKPYYLDGKLEKMDHLLWCDVVRCRPYADFPARTNEMSEEIFMSGVRQPGNIPEYKHRQVKGNIRVTVPYHTDTACESPIRKAVFEFKR